MVDLCKTYCRSRFLEYQFQILTVACISIWKKSFLSAIILLLEFLRIHFLVKLWHHLNLKIDKKKTVRKWIYIWHKLPRTFDSCLSIYDINAYKKCFKKIIWTKKKNHVPQRGIEPPPSLVRTGLARIKWKMSSVLPTELSGHLYNFAPI